MFIIKALKKVLFLDNNDNTVIGLNELKSKNPKNNKVKATIQKSKKLDDVKLCDLIRGID